MRSPLTLLTRSGSARPDGTAGRDGTVTVRLRDGGTATLRPLRRGETEPVQAVFAGMSPAARTDRYLVGMARLPGPMLRALAAVDGHSHVAWLADVDGRPAGIARYVATGECSAEVAFEVVDAHRGRGVGSALVDAVLTVAAHRGYTRVQASVHPANAASLGMLARLGLRLRLVDGLLEGEGALRRLEPARVDRDAVLTAADQARPAQAS
jgi:GNAT superfamily N-acetyltransferase